MLPREKGGAVDSTHSDMGHKPADCGCQHYVSVNLSAYSDVVHIIAETAAAIIIQDS
jgi:hypothetical protein